MPAWAGCCQGQCTGSLQAGHESVAGDHGVSEGWVGRVEAGQSTPVGELVALLVHLLLLGQQVSTPLFL